MRGIVNSELRRKGDHLWISTHEPRVLGYVYLFQIIQSASRCILEMNGEKNE